MNYDYVEDVLIALKNEIQRLTVEEYNESLHLLSGSSFGGHTRHIIEMFHCLAVGYDYGTVNYDKRKRDLTIQTNPNVAIQNIETIINTIRKKDKTLRLESMLFAQEKDIQTSYFRELSYCIEHCIHHQAMLKIALILFEKNVDEDFGVAKSTIQNRQNVYS